MSFINEVKTLDEVMLTDSESGLYPVYVSASAETMTIECPKADQAVLLDRSEQIKLRDILLKMFPVEVKVQGDY